MVPKLEARFSNEYLVNLKQTNAAKRHKINYLKKVVSMMEKILVKLASSEPKLASEEVFAFYSLTSGIAASMLKELEPLIRFPILGNSQRDSVLLSPEQYLPKFLEFVADFKKHFAVS